MARDRAAYAFFGLVSLLIRQVLRNTFDVGSLVSKQHGLSKNLCSDTCEFMCCYFQFIVREVMQCHG